MAVDGENAFLIAEERVFSVHFVSSYSVNNVVRAKLEVSPIF